MVWNSKVLKTLLVRGAKNSPKTKIQLELEMTIRQPYTLLLQQNYECSGEFNVSDFENIFHRVENFHDELSSFLDVR